MQVSDCLLNHKLMRQDKRYYISTSKSELKLTMTQL